MYICVYSMCIYIYIVIYIYIYIYIYMYMHACMQLALSQVIGSSRVRPQTRAGECACLEPSCYVKPGAPDIH